MIQVIGVLLTIIVISGWQVLVESIKGLYWKLSSFVLRPEGGGRKEEVSGEGDEPTEDG